MAYSDNNYGLSGLAGQDVQSLLNAYDTGIAQEESRQRVATENLSKSEEKARRLEQTTQRKARELGRKPLDSSNDDWQLTKTVKSAVNSLLPHDYQLGINEYGGNYNTQNKNFNSDNMNNIWNEVQDDPYGDKVMYYMQVEDGFEDDGITPKNMYKVGFADVSAYDRYRNQLNDQGIKIIGEKRFNSAEDVENRIHGNEQFLQSRAFDRGQTKDESLNSFGSGASELYNKDILGIANNVTEKDFARNLATSKAASYEAMLNYRPTKSNNWARAFGTGAITLAGQVTKLVNTELGQNLMDNAQDITGYSDNDVIKAGKMFRRGLRNYNPVDLIDAILTGGPEVFSQSLPEMLAITGATALTGGGALVAGGASVVSKVKMAKTPIVGMAIVKTNDTLDTRKELNGGQEASLAEVAGVFLSEVLATGLDYGSFKFITDRKFPGGIGISMPGKGTIPLQKMIDAVGPDNSISTIVKFLASIGNASVRGGGKIGLAAGTESAQEVTTELLRMLGEQIGTSKYEGMTVEEVLSQPENMKRLEDSATLGAIGGGAPGVVHGASEVVGNLSVDAFGAPQEYVPKYQQSRNELIALERAEISGKTADGQPFGGFNPELIKDMKKGIEATSRWLGTKGSVDEGIAEDEAYGNGMYTSPEEQQAAYEQFLEMLNGNQIKNVYSDVEIAEMKRIVEDDIAHNKAIFDNAKKGETIEGIRANDVVSMMKKNLKVERQAEAEAEIIEEDAQTAATTSKPNKKILNPVQKIALKGYIESKVAPGHFSRGWKHVMRRGGFTIDSDPQDVYDYIMENETFHANKYGKILDQLDDTPTQTKTPKPNKKPTTAVELEAEVDRRLAKDKTYNQRIKRVKELKDKIKKLEKESKTKAVEAELRDAKGRLKRLENNIPKIRAKIEADVTKQYGLKARAKAKIKQEEKDKKEAEKKANAALEKKRKKVTKIDDELGKDMEAIEKLKTQRAEMLEETPDADVTAIDAAIAEEEAIAQETFERLEKKDAKFREDTGYSALYAVEKDFDVEAIAVEVVEQTDKKKSDLRVAGVPLKKNVGSAKPVKLSSKKFTDKKYNRIVDDTKIEAAFVEGSIDEKMNTTSKNQQTRAESEETVDNRKDFISKIKEAIESKDLFKNNKRQAKLFASMFRRKNEENQALAKVGGSLRISAIAMKHVLDDVRSNVDRATNVGRATKIYASRQNIAEQIGRSIYDSYGMQLVPTKENAERGPEHAYIEIGNIALGLLEEAGLIETLTGKEGVVDPGRQDLYDREGVFVNPESQTIEKSPQPYLRGRNVILPAKGLVTTTENVSEDNLRSNNVKSPMDAVLGRFNKALLPGNERVPEPSFLDKGYEDNSESMPDIESQDHTTSKVEQNVVKELQSKSLFLNFEVVKLLADLAELTRTKTFEQVLNDENYEWVKMMFGLNEDPEAILEYEEQSKAGQKISKKSNAIAVVDAVRSYIDEGYAIDEFNELFFTYFSAVNTRYHVDEIAFNFQADNIFSRHVLNTSEFRDTIEGEKEVEAFVLFLADELSGKGEGNGITPNELMHYEKPVSVSASKKAGTQNILNGINIMLGSSNKLPSMKDILDPINLKDNSTSALFNHGKSPMQIAMLLEAVYDLRKAVANNDGKKGNWKTLKIESRKSIGFDGNTSGFINKLINMLGGENHEALLSLITKLITPDKDGKYGDGYMLLANEVKTLISNKIALAEAGAGLPKDVANVSELKVIMEFINSIDADMRDTSKYPLMNNLYGQLTKSMSRVLSNSIAGKMLNKAKKTTKGEMNKVREQIKELAEVAANPENTTFEEKEALVDVIANSLGKIYAEALGNVNRDLNEETEAIYNAYKPMKDASKILGLDEGLTMRSPFSVVFAAIPELTEGMSNKDIADLESSAYNFSIEKKKLTTKGKAITDDGNVFPTSKEFQSNPNSQKVMPLHAIDSAILMIAFALTIKDFGGKMPNGAMPVHDAVYSNPKFMLAYRKNYNKAAMLVAKHYDLKNETVHQIESLIRGLEKQGTHKDTLTELVKHKDALSANNDTRMKKKSEAIDGFMNNPEASVFGTFNMSMDDTPAVKSTPVSAQEDTEVEVDTSSAQERVTSRSTNQEVKRRFQEVYSNGETYWVVDTEATNNNPDTGEITQFFAQAYSNGKPIPGQTISISAMPSDPIAYEKLRVSLANPKKDRLTGKTKAPINLPTLETLSKESGSDTRDQDAFSDDLGIAYEQMGIGSLDGKPIIVGHKFEEFDDKLIRNNIDGKYDIKAEIIDSLKISMANQEESGRGTTAKTYPAGTNTQGQFYQDMTGKEMGEDAHSAKEDVLYLAEALDQVGKDITPTLKENTNKRGKDNKRKSSLNGAIAKLTSADTKENREAAADLVTKIINGYNHMPDSSQIIIGLENILSWIETGGVLKESQHEGLVGFEYQSKIDAVLIPKNVADSDTKYSFKDIVRYMNHEIEHNVQSVYVRDEMAKPEVKRSNSVRYISKVWEKVEKTIASKGIDAFDDYSSTTDSFGESVAERISYIFTRKDPGVQMAEFTAIYRSNSEFRKAINAVVFENKETLITRFIKSIADIIDSALKLVSIDLRKSISVNVLNDAMNNIVILANQQGESGTSYNDTLGALDKVEDFESTLKAMPYKGEKPVYFLPFEDRISTFNLVSSRWIKQGFKDISKEIKKNKTIKKYHEKGMKSKDGIYAKTINVISDRFEPGTFTTRLLAYMNLTEEFNEVRMREYENALNKAQQTRNRIDTEILTSIKTNFDKATKGMNEEEKATINRAFDNSLIHTLNEIEDTGSTALDAILDASNPKAVFASRIKALEASLTSSLKDELITGYPGGVGSLALDIAKYYDTRRLGALARNNITDINVLTTLDGAHLDMMNQLIALKQLQLIDNKDLDAIRTFREKSSEMTDNPMESLFAASTSNYQMSFFIDKDDAGLNQERFENATGSHINFSENYEFKHFDKVGRGNLNDNANEWIILQEADDHLGIIGVAARIRSDFGFVSGLASSVSLNSDGIDIPFNDTKRLNNEKSNIIRTGTPGKYQYKIILTNDMLANLEVNDHAVSSMLKANGHNTQVFESQSMIKHMINNESIVIDTPQLAQVFEESLANGDKNKPYFIKFEFEADGMNLDDYPNIMNHYGQTKNVTNSLGMNRRVNMVNKNLSDQAQGYVKKPLIDPSNPLLHKWESYLRNFVTMQASHVVMGNPMKIAGDIASNASILAANNVPLVSGYNYGKEAIKYMPQMTRLRNEFVFEQFKLFGIKQDTPEFKAQEAVVAKAKAKIEKHPFYPAIQHGFIQSLSTDMLMKDKDNVNELQKRANTVFEAIDGVPGAHKSIMFLANVSGWGVEKVMAGIALAAPKTQSIQEYTEFVIKKSKRISKDEDVPAFLSEIFATPGQSELLRLGGVAMLSADVTAKWILYKHTIDMYRELNRVNKGVKNRMGNTVWEELSLEEMDRRAGQLAVGSFINYMTNLPRELDMLKDVGVFMFPHFTLRVQKVIGALIVNRLFGTSLAATTMIAAGSFGPSIYGSVVGVKSIGQFSLSGSAILPTELF